MLILFLGSYEVWLQMMYDVSQIFAACIYRVEAYSLVCCYIRVYRIRFWQKENMERRDTSPHSINPSTFFSSKTECYIFKN
jgi:hypothetical protein